MNLLHFAFLRPAQNYDKDGDSHQNLTRLAEATAYLVK